MRWKGGRRSSNVEDQRGSSGGSLGGIGAGAAGGLAMRFLPMLIRSKTGRTVLIIGAVLFFGAKMAGINLLPLLSGQPAVSQSQQKHGSPAEQQLADFTSVVLADTEETWHGIFRAMGKQYREPKLVLFSGQVKSACGMAQSAMGPFYCPGDQKLYIDLSFFRDLKNRHGAPGDFAQAYVIAHEVGHHIQTLLGISAQVHKARSSVSKVQGNQLSVRQELQADCFAGVWGHNANTQRNMLDSGDLNEALVAATAIGDDRLQQQARGHVVPESFTHGSSAQRVRWFKRGFQSGNVGSCDTFSTQQL